MSASSPACWRPIPTRTEWLVAQTLKMDSQDRWVVVRAVAYSGLPRWKPMLRALEQVTPRYRRLSEHYLDGKMATLAEFEVPPTRERLRARAQASASRRRVRRARDPPDPGAEPGSARHPVGLLFRHRRLRADHAHRRHAAAVGRSRRRRPADRRQHGQIHAGHQRHARPRTARYAQERAQSARADQNRPRASSPR